MREKKFIAICNDLLHDKCMSKKNLQVRVPEEIESDIAKLAPGSKSAFVREAIEEKIRRERFRQMEQKWIEALERNPEEAKEARRWLKAEEWGSR